MWSPLLEILPYFFLGWCSLNLPLPSMQKRLHVPASVAKLHSWRQQVIAQVVESPTPTRDIHIEIQAPGFGLVKYWLLWTFEILSLSLSLNYIKKECVCVCVVKMPIKQEPGNLLTYI